MTVKTIYEIPVNFEKIHVSKLIASHFELPYQKPNLKPWEDLLKKIATNKKKLRIGLVGKYVENNDAYLSVTEALKSACYHNGARLEISWINAEQVEKGSKAEYQKMKGMDGLLIPGGFGKRGTEGKIMAAKYARESKTPYFGLCLGAQLMAIEFARNVVNLKNANSEEFEPKAERQLVLVRVGRSWFK